MIYDHTGGIRDPLKQDLALEFCRNQKKNYQYLTETHINHDKIHHIRNNLSGSNFFSLGNSHAKGCLSCFIWDFRLILIQKGGLCPFKFTPTNDRFLCVYAPSGFVRDRFFEGLQNYMKNENKKNENKITLKTLIVLWIIWTVIVKIKHKDFIGAAPVMLCKNSSWIMGLRIYGEGRT